MELTSGEILSLNILLICSSVYSGFASYSAVLEWAQLACALGLLASASAILDSSSSFVLGYVTSTDPLSILDFLSTARCLPRLSKEAFFTFSDSVNLTFSFLP